MDHPESYRGILVSSHVAKVFRNAYRGPSMQHHIATADGLQLGSIPGKGVDFACHTLRSFLRVTQSTSRPCAVFYLDIKSAYYRLLRRLAVGDACSPSDLSKLLTSLNIIESAQRDLHDLMSDPDAFTRMGCLDWLRRFGAAFHMNTWYHARGDSEITTTLRGTRPGDGYADLLFNAVLGHVLRTIEQDLKQRGLETAISWNGSRFHDAAPGDDSKVDALNIVWADDISVMIYHDTAALLLDAIPIVLAEYVGRLAAHGLILNLEKNKTEYKHLGNVIHAKGRLFPELRSRVGQAHTAFGQLRKSVYQNHKLSLAKRVQIFKACVLSILTWNGGTWPPFKDPELAYFLGATRRLVRRFLVKDFPVYKGFGVTLVWKVHGTTPS